MAAKKKNFEEAMARLEEIVSLLERGETPLEESMALFEEGTKLVSGCQRQLEQAEQKVRKLSKGADGAPVETPFEGEE
jgi:exodeoxyribonuclease VII small subunit